MVACDSKITTPVLFITDQQRRRLRYSYLSPLLNLLLLGISLLHVPHEQALAEQLLRPATRLDVQQGIVSVFDHALAKGADAQLHHGSVVEYLWAKGDR